MKSTYVHARTGTRLTWDDDLPQTPTNVVRMFAAVLAAFARRAIQVVTR
jgi:hypothetical protein